VNRKERHLERSQSETSSSVEERILVHLRGRERVRVVSRDGSSRQVGSESKSLTIESGNLGR
jgi:hypothetical protein